MAFIPVPNTLQMSLQGTFLGVPFANVYYFRGVPLTSLTQAISDALAGVFETAYDGSGLEALLSNSWTADKVVVTDLTSATSPQFTSLFVDALVGENGAATLPQQTSQMIEWSTALRGRSFRGRTFLNGLTTACGTSSPNGAMLTATNAYAGGLIAGMHAGGPPATDLAIVSRFSGMHDNLSGHGKARRLPTPRAFGLSTPVTSGFAETQWKTMRRRSAIG